MIGYETYQRIKLLSESDRMSVTQIAHELGLSCPTVRKMLASGRYLPRKYAPRASKLDPFRDTVKRHLERHQYSSGGIGVTPIFLYYRFAIIHS